MKKTFTLRLTVEVAYEPNGVEQAELEARLTDGARRMAGEGLFTGDTPAEVTNWDARVDLIHVGHSSKRK